MFGSPVAAIVRITVSAPSVRLSPFGVIVAGIGLAATFGAGVTAQLGAMRINEEIDALTTMGLGPVRFLVVPRILAGVLVSPLLTLYFNLVSLVGAAVVVMSFGYPLVAYNNQVLHALSLTAGKSRWMAPEQFGEIEEFCRLTNL